MPAACLVKGEDTLAANRRDDGMIGTDRPQDLCHISGTCRQTRPAKTEENAHGGETQFLAKSEHVESPLTVGSEAF
jgi:hypothetical protein